jgi:lycopene beta-cyclase
VGRTSCDIAIIGGGLAGGLTALALGRLRPELKVRLIEAGERLGGNHIWSFFDSDLDAEGRDLVGPLVAHRWSGYDVAFPGHRRRMGGRYNSITSDRFDAVVAAAVDVTTSASVNSATEHQVELATGERIEAKAVIDARGQADISGLQCGWQSFLGQELRLAEPHGLERPVVMDASVEQIGGYRFIYLLPFGARSIFVEDTYYQDRPGIDAAALRGRIAEYAGRRGWTVEKVAREEVGALPVVMGGALPANDLPAIGVRGGLFHPTTGYSLPDAVKTALLIARAPDLSGPALQTLLTGESRRLWRQRGFYRMLDKMLFRAARPEERFRIFERFYRLDEGLIARFYAAQSTTADKIRILSGKPPVPIASAMKALLT